MGAVYDPNLDELFLARADQPATLNGKPIHASEIDALRDGLLATGFPYDQARFQRALRSFEALSLKSLAVRRAGSAALDLCYVACGRLEGYWEHRVNSWDVAAGVLLVQQAGGLVTRPDGAPFSARRPRDPRRELPPPSPARGSARAAVVRAPSCGAPGEIRTPDACLRTATLYPLSYGGVAYSSSWRTGCSAVRRRHS